jgi:outer membrane protein assembly factor BamA
VFNLDYIYDGWFPLLKLRAQKLQTPSFDKQNRLIALTENRKLDAELIFPWLHKQKRWSVHTALRHQASEMAWLAPSYTATGQTFKDTLAGVALVYDTRLTYPRGISTSSTGYILSAQYETGKGLGGTYTGAVTTLSGRAFMDLGAEQVLAMRLDVAKGDSLARPFQLGGVSSVNVLPNVLDPLPASATLNQRQYPLRGYGAGEAALTGQSMALASIEYRFPIARIERGWMAPPIGLHQTFGRVFSDAGRAGNAIQTAKTYVSVGAELGTDMILFYNLKARLQLGVAKGLDKTIGGTQVYFRLGSSF